MEKTNPYVWITSRRLRNPQSTPYKVDNAAATSGFGTSNKKFGACHNGNGNTRRLRTATSADMFGTDQEPAFIDHHGNLIQGATTHLHPRESYEANHEGLRRCSSARKFSNGGNRGGLNGEQNHVGNYPHSHDFNGTSPRSVKILDMEINGMTLSRGLNPSPQNQHCKLNIDGNDKFQSSRQSVTLGPPYCCKQSPIPVVDRAWSRPQSGRNLTRPLRSKSEYGKGILAPTQGVKPRPKTAASGRTGTRSVTFSDGGDLSRGSGSGSTLEEDESSSTGPTTVSAPGRRGRPIRPLSAVYKTIIAKRYLEERLRAMYSKRRATSALARYTSTHPQAEIKKWIPRTAHLGGTQALHAGFSSLSPLAKFRLLGYIAILLGRLMKAIVANCSENTARSATELQWMTVYAEQHDISLAFNKHLYSRDRVSNHVPDWALAILNLNPEERTEQDCRRLHALLRGLKSFDKFTDEIQMSLCRAFTVERVAEGRVVLKSGHVGVNFYFIYSGSVFVNVEDVTKDGRTFMRTAAVLIRGDSFGELALLQDIRRTATVSVREKCELLVVDKNVFASVCPQIFEKELAEKYAFICTLDLFSTNYWSPEALRALSMNAQIQEYKINKVIVADSSIEDWIYACMEGKCQVIRCLSLDKPVKDSGGNRKQSDVVLSEEILQLLSSAAAQQSSGANLQEGDMKENLLSSLGLDYVQTSKKLYLANNHARERKRATLALNETTTLTALMKNRRENEEDVVFLNVGVLQPGEIFDLPSLLDDRQDSETASTLMLVSSGAKIMRVKKVAFLDQASEQAIDNTRTLASKKSNPTEESILESYKCKLAWDDFKANLVHNVLQTKDLRYQPMYRSLSKTTNGVSNRPRKLTSRASHRDSAKIISALRRGQVVQEKEVISYTSSEEDSCDEEGDQATDTAGRTKTPAPRRKSGYSFEDVERCTKNEVVIIRRHLPGSRSHLRLSRQDQEDTLPRTPGSYQMTLNLTKW